MKFLKTDNNKCVSPIFETRKLIATPVFTSINMFKNKSTSNRKIIKVNTVKRRLNYYLNIFFFKLFR